MTTRKTKYWVSYNDNPTIPIGMHDTLRAARIDVRKSKRQDPKGNYTIYRVTKVR
jgi:hypothetical protein